MNVVWSYKVVILNDNIYVEGYRTIENKLSIEITADPKNKNELTCNVAIISFILLLKDSVMYT